MAEYRQHVEPPEVLARNIMVSTRLWIGTAAFFYAGFLFTYFYLEQTDSNHMWRPHAVSAPETWGGAVLATNLIGLAAFALARRSLHRRGEATWAGPAALALVLGLASTGLQAAEWTFAGMHPTDGSFASVFFAWTGFYTLNLFLMCYWLWTLIIEPVRARRAFGSSVVLQSSAAALQAYWLFFAVVGIIEYILLYLVS